MAFELVRQVHTHRCLKPLLLNNRPKGGSGQKQSVSCGFGQNWNLTRPRSSSALSFPKERVGRKQEGSLLPALPVSNFFTFSFPRERVDEERGRVRSSYGVSTTLMQSSFFSLKILQSSGASASFIRRVMTNVGSILPSTIVCKSGFKQR